MCMLPWRLVNIEPINTTLTQSEMSFEVEMRLSFVVWWDARGFPEDHLSRSPVWFPLQEPHSNTDNQLQGPTGRRLTVHFQFCFIFTSMCYCLFMPHTPGNEQGAPIHNSGFLADILQMSDPNVPGFLFQTHSWSLKDLCPGVLATCLQFYS